MPSGTNTPKLDLLRIQEIWQFGDDSFNRFIDDADDKLVGVSHLISPMHWTEWKPETVYVKGDVVRYPNLKSHQYAVCLVGGTSDIEDNIPTNNITGSIIDDDTVKWEVCSLTEADPNGGTIRIWLAGTYYRRGEAVRYGDALYRAKIDHQANNNFEVDENKWQEIYASIRFWKPNTYYYLDDTAIYGDIVYKCIRAHKSVSSFEDNTSVSPPVVGDESDWEIVGGAGGAKDWTTNTKYQYGQLVLINGILYRCNTKHRSDSTSFSNDVLKWDLVEAQIHDWVTAQYYVAGTLVAYNNVIYKCLTNHTASANFETDINNWVLYHNHITTWGSNKAYYQGQIILYENILYRAIDTHVSDSSAFDNDVSTHWEYICASLPEWAIGEPYIVGQIVLYNNRIYKCSVAHTSTSTFDTTKWSQILASPIIEDWQANTVYIIGQLVLNAGNLYKANQMHTSDSTSILPDILKWDLVYASVGIWDEAINYKAGQLVIYNNKLYKCNTNHLSSTTFDHTKFDAVVSFPVIEEWQVDINYLENQVVKFNDMLLIAVDTHTSDSTDIINDLTTPNIHWNLVYANIQTWQANIAYKVGIQVIYNNNLYQAKDTHTSGSTFDIGHWELIGQFDAFVYDWQANKYYYANQVAIKDKELYRSDSNHTSANTWDADKVNWTKISSVVTIDDWADNTEYLVNEVVIWNGVLYRCNTAHTSTTIFDGTKFTPIYANIASWQASTQYLVDQLVMYNNQLYKCITAHTSQSAFEPDGAKWQPVANNIAGIPAWESGVYYYQNQVVKHNGKLWRCLTAHTSGVEEKPDYAKAFERNQDFLYYNSWNGYPLSDTPKDFDIDIGSTVRGKRIVLYCQRNGINAVVSVKVSIDGVNFKTLDTILCDASSETIDFYSDVRYIKITAESVTDYTGSPDSTHYFRFHELDLYSVSNKWELIVDPDIRITYWQQNADYNKDEIVIYNDEFYKCINTNFSGTTFNASDWKKIPRMVIPDWKADEDYILNQVVFYDGKLYKCIVAHTSSSTFTQANWKPVNDFIDTWQADKYYYVGQAVWYNNSLWRCKTSHKSSTETPNDNIVYTSTTNIAEVTDTTTIPYEEIIDLGDTYLIESITYDVVATNMSAKYYLEVSEDDVTYTVFDKYESITSARYIKVIAYSVDIETGVTNPDVYLDNFIVKAQSNKWQEISTMNTLTDEEIDSMFI